MLKLRKKKSEPASEKPKTSSVTIPSIDKAVKDIDAMIKKKKNKDGDAVKVCKWCWVRGYGFETAFACGQRLEGEILVKKP